MCCLQLLQPPTLLLLLLMKRPFRSRRWCQLTCRRLLRSRSLGALPLPHHWPSQTLARGTERGRHTFIQAHPMGRGWGRLNIISQLRTSFVNDRCGAGAVPEREPFLEMWLVYVTDDVGRPYR